MSFDNSVETRHVASLQRSALAPVPVTVPVPIMIPPMPAPQVSVDSTVLSLKVAVEPTVLASGRGVLMKFSVGGVEVPVSFTMPFPESLVEALVPPVLVAMSKDYWSANQQTCERKSSNKNFWPMSLHNVLLKRERSDIKINTRTLARSRNVR